MFFAASETPEQKAARKAAKASMDPAAKVPRQNQHNFFFNRLEFTWFLFQAEKEKLKALEKAKESKAGGGAAKEKKEKKEKK